MSEDNGANDSEESCSLFSRCSECLLSLGQRFDEIIRKSFKSYGQMCTRKPWIFILPLFGVGLALGLSVGILKFVAMTDPVSLWSAPNSRARVEKEFFDENFGPFYRVEQMIIRPTNQAPIIYPDPSNSSKHYTFGPAFRKEFLLQVLELQNRVTAITAEINGTEVELTDLCFSPMQNNLCAIQTPLGWFQSKATNLDKTDKNGTITYLDHLRQCMNSPLEQGNSDPLKMSCAGHYGGPMLPNVALAEFEENNYLSAKSVVITITLKNHIKSEDNSRALEWEKNYLNFMHNFSSPDMKVVYYSEVFPIWKN